MATSSRQHRRLAPAAFLLLLVASLWASLGSAQAGAQESPPTSAAPGSVPSPTTTSLPEQRSTPANRLVPGGQYGDFPLDAYDYMYSTNEDGRDDILGVDIPGVNLNLPVPTSQEQGRRTVTGMIASWAFAATVTIVKLALLIVGWAFNFPLLGLLSNLVQDLVNKLEGQFIGPAGIRAGVAVLAAFIAGWYLLTARLVHGLREALIGVVMIALAGMMVSNIDRYYQAASDFGAGISSVIIGLAGNSQETGVEAVQAGMAQALVAEPWALLNYGNPLEGACAQAAREVLATGPHGTDGSPRQTMRAAGCRDEAAFNQDPTTERAIDAGLLFLGVMPAALFMVLVAFSLLIAQFRLAIAFVIAPGALLLGAVASTRHLAGRWALFAVKALLGIIAPVVVLSAMALVNLLILTGIDFSVTVGGVRIDLVAKLVLINAANFALFMKRKVIADGIYRATTVKADRALVKAGVPTAGPEVSKPLAERLDKQHVMPGVRDPIAAATNRTKTAVGGARAGTAKVATTAATVAAGPAARGSMAAAAVLGVAQKTAVATGGNTTDGEGRRTGTAAGGGTRRAGGAPSSSPVGVGAGSRAPGVPIGTAAPPVLPSAAFATAAAAGDAPGASGPGAIGVTRFGGGVTPAGPLNGATPNGASLHGGPLNGASSPNGHGTHNGQSGLLGPAAAAGPFATAAASVGPRPGVGYGSGAPATGGAFATLNGGGTESHTPANGSGAGIGNGNGGLFDVSALDSSRSGAADHHPRGSNGWPIPPPPPAPQPAEPVGARAVSAAVHSPVPAYNPIGPIPPPPGPGTGDEA